MRETVFLGSMPREQRLIIARVLWLSTAAAALAGVVLGAVNRWQLGFDPWGVQVAGAVLFGSLGMLVVSKRPTNVMGWLMLWMGALDGLSAFGLQYGLLATTSGPLPLGRLIGTVPYGLAVGAVFGTLITFFLLLFPDGKLPSPRWRPVAWAAGLGLILMSVGITLHTWSEGVAGVLAELEAGGLQAEGPAEILNGLGHTLVFLVFPLAVASLFVRRRRAGSVERQQLKLFAYGAVVFLSSVFIPLPEPYWMVYEMSATAFLFAAVAIAIIRYHLYDIDRLVSRTVVYIGVTGAVVVIYLAGVFVLQRILPTGNDFTIAASTLAAAAAFNPLRRRMQQLVDRQFNRSRYDAAHTIESFSHRLRGATDVEDLTAHLGRTAASIMEPSHVSLWLTEPQA